MIYISINYMAVIVAAISTIIVGSLWYGPLFGKHWVKMMGWTPQQIEEGKKKGMMKSYILSIVGSLISACVLAKLAVLISSYSNLSGISAGLEAGFLGWLLVIPVTLSTVLWEGRSWKLWLINVGHYLVSFLIMGMILGYWM